MYGCMYHLSFGCMIAWVRDLQYGNTYFYEPCTTTCYATSSFFSPSPSTFSPYSSFLLLSYSPSPYMVVTPIVIFYINLNIVLKAQSITTILFGTHTCVQVVHTGQNFQQACTDIDGEKSAVCIMDLLRHAPIKKANRYPTISSHCITESPLASFFTEQAT